ncbi:hypothetical protein DPMN_061044 [Dreissena polymorpha]|uniref:Uncharacterized protein n=1 Tax=Dreissena polymorpha TaxID=45954 RepID=A0A9D4C776_DREPO|nr:hypothetical protein DPMN_061044 [Dreissena polymorpha]
MQPKLKEPREQSGSSQNTASVEEAQGHTPVLSIMQPQFMEPMVHSPGPIIMQPQLKEPSGTLWIQA